MPASNPRFIEKAKGLKSDQMFLDLEDACAPLAKLLGYAHNFAGPNTVHLFLKGQNLGAELTEAHKSWKMKTRQIPSQTSTSGAILEVREFSPHANPSKS